MKKQMFFIVTLMVIMLLANTTISLADPVIEVRVVNQGSAKNDSVKAVSAFRALLIALHGERLIPGRYVSPFGDANTDMANLIWNGYEKQVGFFSDTVNVLVTKNEAGFYASIKGLNVLVRLDSSLKIVKFKTEPLDVRGWQDKLAKAKKLVDETIKGVENTPVKLFESDSPKVKRKSLKSFIDSFAKGTKWFPYTITKADAGGYRVFFQRYSYSKDNRNTCVIKFDRDDKIVSVITKP